MNLSYQTFCFGLYRRAKILWTFYNLKYIYNHNMKNVENKTAYCSRCKSVTFFPESFSSCSIEPIHTTWKQKWRQVKSIKKCWSKKRKLDIINSIYLFVVITDPQWNWCTPVSVTRDIPITSIFKPIVKAFLFDKLWYPI